MEIILYQPQIPQNTGNIIRTCYLTSTKLTLVTPLGFDMDDKYLKRAGLDYYQEVVITLVDTLMTYLEKQSVPIYFFSSQAKTCYTHPQYAKNSILIFGSETAGLPPIYQKKWPERFVTIPMNKGRCLNLSNAAAIALYEALRQNNFNFDK